MTEPDVTLTDFALAIECAVFTVLARRWQAADARLRRSWAILFAFTGLGSVFGGIVHGFVPDERTPTYALLWAATLLCIGMSSTAMWMIGSYMQLGEPIGARVRRAALALLTAYAAVVLFFTTNFVVAIAAYLPATLFLLVAFGRAYARFREAAVAGAMAGLALTFAAAAVQQLRISIHPVYLNYNALYHVMQGVALFLVFLGARHDVARDIAVGGGDDGYS